MTSPLDAPAGRLAPSARAFPGADPDVLREATARMNALGIHGEVVHATSDPAEVLAYLESLPACVPAT